MYACLAVTCHLHFWQNDRDFLRATVVTRGWNGYRNKSQHRKSTLEKKILPPFQQGFEPATFQSRVRCSNHWAIPAPMHLDLVLFPFVGGAQFIRRISLRLVGFLAFSLLLLSRVLVYYSQHQVILSVRSAAWIDLACFRQLSACATHFLFTLFISRFSRK